jgi:hypothetical protein
MWTPEISINGQTVLAHGTVVSYGNQPIDLFPLPSPSNKYLVRLTFEQRLDTVPSIAYNAQSHYIFVCNVINFDSGTITGHSTPIYVANHLGRKVLLSLTSQFIGQPIIGTRVVNYTFTDGGPS